MLMLSVEPPSDHQPWLLGKLRPVFLVLALLGSTFVTAQQSQPTQFSAQEFLEPIKYLASDQLQGRGDGTPQLDEAAKYLAEHFRKFGLKPAGDDGKFLQHFTLVVGAKLGERNSVTFKSSAHEETLKLEENYVPISFSSSSTASAPLVFAGYGITAPEYDYDDYKGIDASGRIVIVLRHEPQENDEKSVFEGRQLTSHAEIASKATNAKNHGAVGMILINDVGNHPGDPDALLRPDDISGPQEMNIPIVQVKPAIADEWLKPSGHTLDDLRQQIDKDLSAHSFALDPTAQVAMSVDIERIHRQVANVVGLLPGADPAVADQYIIVGAHYDHLGLGDQHSLPPHPIGQIHHGADDNASGTAACWNYATYLANRPRARPHHRFRSLSRARKPALSGSADYTKHPPSRMAQTFAMINMDMVGRIRDNRALRGRRGHVGRVSRTSCRMRTIRSAARFAISFSASGYGPATHVVQPQRSVPCCSSSPDSTPIITSPPTPGTRSMPPRARAWRTCGDVTEGLDNLNQRPQYVRVAEPSPSAAGGGSGYGPYFGSIPDFGEVEHRREIRDVRDGSRRPRRASKPAIS